MFRNLVRVVLVVCLVLAICFVAVLIATAIIRVGLAYMFQFFVAGVSAMVAAVVNDPYLIIAITLAILILWAIPWESILELHEEDPLVRGRSVENHFDRESSLWQDED
jgi:hypothetical protein